MKLSEADEALIEAVRDQNIDGVKDALRNGADVQADNNAALLWAVEDGNRHIVRLLLDCGADIHARDDKAIVLATEYHYREIARILLHCGADPHNPKHEWLDTSEATRLREWIGEMKQDVLEHFTSDKPTWEQCFVADTRAIPRFTPKLHDRILDACTTGQFTSLIGAPLIASTDKADRQLFQDIWNKLPKLWQEQYQDNYMQFVKAGGLTPVIGAHTGAQRHGATPDTTMGR